MKVDVLEPQNYCPKCGRDRRQAGRWCREKGWLARRLDGCIPGEHWHIRCWCGYRWVEPNESADHGTEDKP